MLESIVPCHEDTPSSPLNGPDDPKQGVQPGAGLV